MKGILLALLADGETRTPGPEFGKASPVGLLVVVLLVIATVFLVRSMNRQLEKVPESFDRQNPGADQDADEGTDAIRGNDHGADGSGSAQPPGSRHEPG
ncbi:hypothetical protein [Mycobacterium sp.]|uniref:hypothetical protein n=1 Tax=Mycobacterium sp. TaxID=1785 RepID=UPI003A8768DC